MAEQNKKLGGGQIQTVSFHLVSTVSDVCIGGWGKGVEIVSRYMHVVFPRTSEGSVETANCPPP